MHVALPSHFGWLAEYEYIVERQKPCKSVFGNDCTTYPRYPTIVTTHRRTEILWSGVVAASREGFMRANSHGFSNTPMHMQCFPRGKSIDLVRVYAKLSRKMFEPVRPRTVLRDSSPRTRLGNRLVRVSVFGSKSCVFLAVCGQIWP